MCFILLQKKTELMQHAVFSYEDIFFKEAGEVLFILLGILKI